MLYLLQAVIGLLACKTTQILINKYGLNSILASSLITIIFLGLGLLVSLLIPFDYNNSTLQAVILGATFIGMSSKEIFANNYIVIISVTIFILCFNLTNWLCIGLGGGLGTIASISVISSYSVFHLLGYTKKR